MRILSHSFAVNSIYQVRGIEEDYQAALRAACTVLDIDPSNRVEDLSPSDARAIEGITTFFRSLRSSDAWCKNQAYSVVNLNTGKSVLFLMLHIDYNGEF